MPFQITATMLGGDGLGITDPGVYPVMLNVNAEFDSGPSSGARVGELHALATVAGVPAPDGATAPAAHAGHRTTAQRADPAGGPTAPGPDRCLLRRRSGSADLHRRATGDGTARRGDLDVDRVGDHRRGRPGADRGTAADARRLLRRSVRRRPADRCRCGHGDRHRRAHGRQHGRPPSRCPVRPRCPAPAVRPRRISCAASPPWPSAPPCWPCRTPTPTRWRWSATAAPPMWPPRSRPAGRSPSTRSAAAPDWSTSRGRSTGRSTTPPSTSSARPGSPPPCWRARRSPTRRCPSPRWTPPHGPVTGVIAVADLPAGALALNTFTAVTAQNYFGAVSRPAVYAGSRARAATDDYPELTAALAALNQAGMVTGAALSSDDSDGMTTALAYPEAARASRTRACRVRRDQRRYRRRAIAAVRVHRAGDHPGRRWHRERGPDQPVRHHARRHAADGRRRVPHGSRPLRRRPPRPCRPPSRRSRARWRSCRRPAPTR